MQHALHTIEANCPDGEDTFTDGFVVDDALRSLDYEPHKVWGPQDCGSQHFGQRSAAQSTQMPQSKGHNDSRLCTMG